MLFGLSTLDIIGILVVIFLILLIPMILRRRIVSGVTKSVLELEDLVSDGKEILIKTAKEKGNPPHDPESAVENYMEYFVIPPVDLDPNGIVRKLDKILETDDLL